MPDSTSKKILDSALIALLKGCELSPWVKVPAEFIAQLTSRFRHLPEKEKSAIVDANAAQLSTSLAAASCDQPELVAEAVSTAARRGSTLDYLFGLSTAAVAELVARTPGASPYVTKNAPVKEKVAEFVEFVESSDGPGLDSLDLPIKKA